MREFLMDIERTARVISLVVWILAGLVGGTLIALCFVGYQDEAQLLPAIVVCSSAFPLLAVTCVRYEALARNNYVLIVAFVVAASPALWLFSGFLVPFLWETVRAPPDMFVIVLGLPFAALGLLIPGLASCSLLIALVVGHFRCRHAPRRDVIAGADGAGGTLSETDGLPVPDELRERVVLCLAEFLSRDALGLRPSDRLYQDLGLSGDCAREFIDGFSGKFGVDLAGLDFERHFPLEPWGWSSAILTWRWWTRRLPDQPLTVEDLVQAATCGRLATHHERGEEDRPGRKETA